MKHGGRELLTKVKRQSTLKPDQRVLKVLFHPLNLPQDCPSVRGHVRAWGTGGLTPLMIGMGAAQIHLGVGFGPASFLLKLTKQVEIFVIVRVVCRADSRQISS